jgi:glycosyl transferase family 2
MSISFIVASNHWPTLRDNLGSTVRGVGDDEVVVVENPESIAKAYNEGQARATQPIRCYIHSDVQILDPVRLRAELLAHCRADVGLVGVIGSRTPTLPWWDGDTCGSVVDGRMGLLDFGSGGECAVLDGLLLATAQTVVWDETYPGFHLYDHDMCRQTSGKGLPNVCLNRGHELVLHNTTGGFDVHALTGWDEGVARFNEKWGKP